MPNQLNTSQSPSAWLGTYYFTRAAVSIVWIVLAFLVGRANPVIAAILLVAYPAWDAVANYIDAQKNGGLRANPTQALNLAVSVITAIAVAYALSISMNTVFVVFGVWATLSGLLQLATGVRRWRTSGTQWLMILSGVQSALAGFFFIMMARGAAPPDISSIAGYAGFGAFYFLISAIWLTVRMARRRTVAVN